MSGHPVPDGNRGKLGYIRPATTPDALAGAARKIALMLATFDPGGDSAGCAICGIGPHVERCPVPALRRAKEDLDFMAAVPVASTAPVRGVAS